jgi:hypothetical protein
LERTGDCEASDTGASAGSDAGVVVVDGCIEGPAGCSQPELQSARVEGGRLVVTVGTVETAEICTQQLVYRGYGVRVETTGGLPVAVEVRHTDGERARTVTETTL